MTVLYITSELIVIFESSKSNRSNSRSTSKFINRNSNTLIFTILRVFISIRYYNNKSNKRGIRKVIKRGKRDRIIIIRSSKRSIIN